MLHPSSPWSLRVVLLLVVAGAGAFAWIKRPFVSDAEKVCKVAELSGCPWPEISVVGNYCKIAWLERSMWGFGQLAQMPEESGGGAFLRRMAQGAGLYRCPEADVVDREFERRQQEIEATRRLLEPPEAQPEPDVDAPDEKPPTKEARGIVTMKAPTVDGDLDPSLVSKEVRARIAGVKACYDKALRQKANLSGQVKVRWVITPTGSVSAVEIDEDTMGDTEVTTCVKALVSRWRFPAPSGSVDVVYPFEFKVSP